MIWEPGGRREGPCTKEHQAMYVGAGRREVEHGCSQIGWVGQDNLTGIEDGEDRRERRRSVRADDVRILWRGNTWRMPARCMASTCSCEELIQDGVHRKT